MPHVEAYSCRNCPDDKPFWSVSGVIAAGTTLFKTVQFYAELY